jgi:hypothetical protein
MPHIGLVYQNNLVEKPYLIAAMERTEWDPAHRPSPPAGSPGPSDLTQDAGRLSRKKLNIYKQ